MHTDSVTKPAKAALLSERDQAFVSVSIVLPLHTESMQLIHHMFIENEHICLNISKGVLGRCEDEEQDLSKVCRQ